MTNRRRKYPSCYGVLDAVFPLTSSGLREAPDRCSQCPHKTACLRTAMSGVEGLTVRQEITDRAYASGRISFWQRWSRRKSIERRRKQRTKQNGGSQE